MVPIGVALHQAMQAMHSHGVGSLQEECRLNYSTREARLLRRLPWLVLVSISLVNESRPSARRLQEGAAKQTSDLYPGPVQSPPHTSWLFAIRRPCQADTRVRNPTSADFTGLLLPELVASRKLQSTSGAISTGRSPAVPQTVRAGPSWQNVARSAGVPIASRWAALPCAVSY